MKKSFENMKKDDLELLEELMNTSRKVVATRRGIKLLTLNGWVYRICKRYHQYNGYINPIRNIIGRAEHLKRSFMKTQPDFEDEDDDDD